jgi:hypothetical protein
VIPPDLKRHIARHPILDHARAAVIIDPRDENAHDAELERVTKLIAEQLNSRPLLDAIADSLKRDGVPFTMEDMEVLRRHRRVRNDVDHGRRLVLPSPRDAREVLSLLTRALGWRLAQSSAEA